MQRISQATSELMVSRFASTLCSCSPWPSSIVRVFCPDSWVWDKHCQELEPSTEGILVFDHWNRSCLSSISGFYCHGHSKSLFFTIKGWTYFIEPPKVLVFPYVGIFQVVQKWPFMAYRFNCTKCFERNHDFKNKFKS